MWLVKRTDPKPGETSLKLSEAEASALRAVYAAKATEGQMDRILTLLHRIRRNDYWIACDCRGAEQVFPLTSPAYLTTSGAYYLRRLTGKARANHAQDCVFRFDRPALDLAPAPKRYDSAITEPTGLFSALAPERAGHVSEIPHGSASTDRRAKNLPRLARLLWRLMTLAGCHEWRPVQHSEQPTIRTAFSALRAASERLDVHDGTALARVIGFHPQDYHSNRLFARIRAAQKTWGHDEPPQGFLCLYARDVKGSTLYFNKENSIGVAGELARPASGDAARRAPYLVLAVIGEAGGREGLSALRAYAQPIYSPTQFLPVESGFERDVVRAVNSLRWSMARTDPHLHIALSKPMFDLPTPDGPCRPDIVLEITDMNTGELRNLVVEAMGLMDDPDYVAAKEITHKRMSHIGPVFCVAPGDLDQPKRIAGRMSAALRGGDN